LVEGGEKKVAEPVDWERGSLGVREKEAMKPGGGHDAPLIKGGFGGGGKAGGGLAGEAENHGAEKNEQGVRKGRGRGTQAWGGLWGALLQRRDPPEKFDLNSEHPFNSEGFVRHLNGREGPRNKREVK